MGQNVEVRLKQITVKGLFGIFDHVILLNLAERVTVLLAPNGFGKTTILRMVNDLLGSAGDWSNLINQPFQELHLEMDDGREMVADSRNPPITLPANQWGDMREQLRVAFIRTERLTEAGAVSTLTSRLAAAIEEALAKNAEVSSALERSFPKRLLQHRGPSLTDEQIRIGLGELEKRRDRLMRLGILETHQGDDLSAQTIGEEDRRMLGIYLNDTDDR